MDNASQGNPPLSSGIDKATSFRLQTLPWNSQNSIILTGSRPSPRQNSPRLPSVSSLSPTGFSLHSTSSFFVSSSSSTHASKSPTLASTTPKTIIADFAASSSSSSSSIPLTLETAVAERDRLYHTLAKVRETLEETNIRLNAVNSQLMVARSEADTAQKDTVATRKIANKKEEEYRRLRKQYETALVEIAELRSSTAFLASSLAKMSEGRSEALAERDAVNTKLKSLRSVERRLIIVLAVRCEAYRLQIQDLRKTITSVNGERDALRRKVQSPNVDQTKLNTLEIQLKESNECEEALRSTVIFLSAQLETSRSTCTETQILQKLTENQTQERSRTQRRLVLSLAVKVAALRHQIEQSKQGKVETIKNADSPKQTIRAKLSTEHRIIEKLTMELSRAQAERDEAKANLVKLSLEFGQNSKK